MKKNIDIVAAYKRQHAIPDNTILLTYGKWRSSGYQVKKGEKCKYRIHMWKYVEKNDEEKGRCYQKTMYLFDQTQVEKIV